MSTFGGLISSVNIGIVNYIPERVNSNIKIIADHTTLFRILKTN